MLDFRIETFLCVCKHMSYTKAAEELRMTQPGVSQHIKYLENHYGDKLFIYRNRTLTLTEAGTRVRDAMISINHDSMHLKKTIRDNSMKIHTVKFGATLTIGEFMLPVKIIEFLKANPQTQIEFIIGDTKELLRMLEDGIIDFAIVEGYFQKGQYESIVVSNEEYVLVCGKDYPLKDGIQLEDLFSQSLIVREDGSGTKEILERFLSEKGYSISDFKKLSTVNSIHVIKQLVEQGCGISFMYEIAVRKELEEGKLRTIQIPGFKISHEFNYIWRKHSVFDEYYKSLFSSIYRK